MKFTQADLRSFERAGLIPKGTARAYPKHKAGNTPVRLHGAKPLRRYGPNNCIQVWFEAECLAYAMDVKK
jgi:hypothetical protein